VSSIGSPGLCGGEKPFVAVLYMLPAPQAPPTLTYAETIGRGDGAPYHGRKLGGSAGLWSVFARGAVATAHSDTSAAIAARSIAPCFKRRAELSVATAHSMHMYEKVVLVSE
jgi:hypothetical protein